MNTITSALQTVAILGYHKVGEPPENGWYTWNYVPEEIFEKHLQYLKDNDWAVIDEKQFLYGLDKPETLPAKSALITFDDGYRSNLQIALPVLQKFSYPAIVFVPTALVGGYNAFDADIFYEPIEQICSWEELKELEHSGISIQSHGVSHPHFSEISHQEIKHEVRESKMILEANLNKEVGLFAFPYGDSGKDINATKAILQECGYSSAFLYQGGVFDIGHHDTFQIPRIPVGADTDIESELKKVSFL